MEESRKQFDAWFKSDYHPDKTGSYLKDAMFFAWQASRAAIEIDIDWPEANDDFWKDGEDGAYASGHTDGRQQTTDAVVRAIRAAGLTVKGDR